MGVAGWIGAVFLLIFVGLGFKFVMESAGIAFVVGLAACTAAGALFRAKPDSDFATQFGLAVSLAGQGLVLFALTKELSTQASAIALSMSLLQTVLFLHLHLLCQTQVDSHRLVDRVQICLLKNANVFDQTDTVEGADLIRFDLGVLG